MKNRQLLIDQRLGKQGVQAKSGPMRVFINIVLFGIQPICLRTVYGCFHITTAELSSYNRVKVTM